ncbi:hypothetical protein LCGC14_1820900 [marine sediment metagenome]|uniref:Uncharacterized protein n=1 Tax=marine sediment metagenome TaxID=412755 RepID=A0A0F9GJ09_9ZZZZ
MTHQVKDIDFIGSEFSQVIASVAGMDENKSIEIVTRIGAKVQETFFRINSRATCEEWQFSSIDKAVKKYNNI